MYTYRAEIVRVVDGDTVDINIDLGFGVWLNDERVRLAGVDTPESRTSDKVEKLFGKAAGRYVEERLPVGSMQVLVTKKYDSKGKFGRILGDFALGGSSICEQLIESGNAVPYNAQNKAMVQDQHMANRQRLINEGVVTQDQINEVS